MIFWNRRQMLILAAVAPLATSRRAIAAAYPDRPVRIVIPYTAGGVAETLMRLLATKIEPRLGQKLVIEAKPGAAGNIGTLDVAYATPDGYTLLVAATNNYVINQYMTKMPVDPLTALAPVAKIADVPLVLFTNKQVPFRTFSEMIDFARAHPGKLSYGVPSLGTVNHLLMERLKQTAGLDITAIPYRGSPQATLALLSNDIQLYRSASPRASGRCGTARLRRSRWRPSSGCRCCRRCRRSRSPAFPALSRPTGGAWARRRGRRRRSWKSGTTW